ncbi:zinc finger protein Xfin-like [Mizuhopecten yessoensis]|uniref:zinc finger protein Xfin-like n=1 Tax=Mizuhopecten yessoensis TaxID=6573 RepID=UPI000B45EBE4|nr:zinc finger protein Xfin-like [Mizuhopecten yessoensis]
MDDGRTRFKQEPLSPGAASRHGHDLMAMQQTYHQGEVLSRTGTQCALDMSQSGRTATITAGMPYIPDTMTAYALTAHDVTPAYAIQDRNLMLGMYGYAPVVSEGKGAGHVDLLTNGMESTEVNGCNGTGPPEKVQPKLRNTALPGMGKRSHLPKRYKCAMCAYRTRYKSDLNRHVRKHAVATFNCEICNMPFKTIGNVEFHKRKEHADLLVTAATTSSGPGKDQPPKHSCKHCDYSTSYSSDLTRHVRKHFSSKFHCILCNRPFMTFSSLATHKRTAHNTGDVIESEGDGGIAEDVSLVEGGVIEESEALVGEGVIEDGGASDVDMVEEVSVSKTGEARERSWGLSMQEVNGDHKENNMVVEDENRHIAETNHVPEEETNVNKVQSSPSKASNSPDNVICTKYTCEYCNKSFGRKLVLDYHLKNIHKVVKSGQEDTDVFVEYPDDDYDLALDMSIQELENATSDSLADRALDAIGKLRHQCQLCAYGTNYKSTFDRHVRKHDLECHICDVCRMPFITFGHLQRHIRDNHPEHTQSCARKEPADGHQERTPVSARKEPADGRSVVYDFLSNDPNTRGTNPSSPSRYKLESPALSQSPFHWMTANKPSVQSSGKGETGESVGTKFNWAGQRRVSSVEEGVTTSPPTSGRYAKLVSDYDSFAEKPFACALCFYRTGDVSSLVEHAENHLTGCSLSSVPDSCMFRVGNSMLNGGADLKSQMRCPILPTYSVYAPPLAGEHSHEERSRGFATPNEIAQSQFVYSNNTRALMTKNIKSGQGTKSQGRCVPENQDQGHQIYSQENNLTIPYRQQTEIMGQQSSNIGATSVTVADSQTRNDRMIPTFSVHYRKDKTNKVRPYLCLLCRKRFRHLMLLKQHFKVTHSESQVGTPRFYTCRICKEVFNNPMLLQEHHDINH